MPMRREDYPPDWEQISEEKRAIGHCEWCEVKNHAIIHRFDRGGYRNATGCELLQLTLLTIPEGYDWDQWKALKYLGLTRVILTTAHLDRDRTNNAEDNLAALCQRCHLGYDMPQHIRNRRYGRDHDRPHQLRIF